MHIPVYFMFPFYIYCLINYLILQFITQIWVSRMSLEFLFFYQTQFLDFTNSILVIHKLNSDVSTNSIICIIIDTFKYLWFINFVRIWKEELIHSTGKLSFVFKNNYYLLLSPANIQIKMKRYTQIRITMELRIRYEMEYNITSSRPKARNVSNILIIVEIK